MIIPVTLDKEFYASHASHKDEELDIKDLQKDEAQKRTAQAELRHHIENLENLISRREAIDDKKLRKENLTAEEKQLEAKCSTDKLKTKMNSYLEQARKYRKEIGDINKEIASITKSLEHKQAGKVITTSLSHIYNYSLEIQL